MKVSQEKSLIEFRNREKTVTLMLKTESALSFLEVRKFFQLYKYEEYIAKETLAISVATGEISHKNVSNHEIEGEKITLAMEQVNS